MIRRRASDLAGGWAFPGPIGVAVFALLVALPAPAQAGRSATEEGNRLYDEGRFAEAHDKYLEALREAPDSPTIRFNDGSALYQGEDYANALEAFRAAIESGDPRLLADAWYNAGNAFYRQGQLDESREAFEQALRARPSDIDAKHNLERVLERMQQQQQDGGGDGEDDEGQGDENQEDQRPQGSGAGQDDESGEDEQDGGRERGEEEPPPQNEPSEGDEPPNEGQASPPGGDSDDDRDADEEPPPGGEPAPGPMTREEAERLLDAIQEDQDEVDRSPRTATRGVRPRKDWQ